MQLLTTTTVTGSIVSPLQVLSYPGHSQLSLVLIRVNLQGVVGNGVYVVSVLINNQVLAPVVGFNVPNGVTSLYALSREVALEPSDTLKITVTGLGGDTAVTVVTSLYSVTPLDSLSLSGGGAVLVNQDYPTTGAMTLLDGAGMPIVGACIYVYSATDFTANRLAPEYIVGRSITTTGGAWATPVSLDPGNYYAYFFKQGVMSPTNIGFTVT